MNNYFKVENFLPHHKYQEVLDYVTQNDTGDNPPWDFIISTFKSMLPAIVHSLRVDVIVVGEVRCWKAVDSVTDSTGDICFIYSLQTQGGIFIEDDWVDCDQNSLIAFPTKTSHQAYYNPQLIIKGCFDNFDMQSVQPSLLIE